MRAGSGYDSHRFTEDRPLRLGGVLIPDAPGLAGHSDGDAVLHALVDAVLGAAALGNVGEMFPDTDPRHAGADSSELLALAVARLHGEGYRVVNADVTVIAERPKLQGHVAAMRKRIAELLDVTPADVSVKGKTNEGLGWIGRGEGLAVMAVALVDRDPA